MKIKRQIRPQYVNVYVADDGTEFDSKMTCEKYEADLKAEKYKSKVKDSAVFRNRIEDFRDFMDENPGTLFRMCSKEDHDIIMYGLMHGENIFMDDYDRPGWYILTCINGGDGPDTYTLENYEEYRESLLAEVQYHIQSTDRCIANMELELLDKDIFGKDDE